MEEQPARSQSQHAIGPGIIAQSQEGGTTIVTIGSVYQNVQPQVVDEATLADAQKLLSTLPIAGDIPPISVLPRGSRMPFTPNPLFVGRQDDFMHLAEALKGEGDDTSTAIAAIGQIAAASGLGGIGKTQLAVEFVHRYGRYFQGGVFWLSFADPNGISSEISTCGGPANLDLRPDYDNLLLDDQVKLVLAAWSSPLPRLLVLDNCEDQALLAHWRPPTGGCSVLVTSRRAQWDAALGVHSLPLGVLSPDESVSLLHKHRPDLSANDPDLAAIAEELGYLPLALHLAGSFLARYRYALSPQEYLQELRGKGLLGHASLEGKGTTYSPTGHEHHVRRTFALSYERLDATDPNDALAIKLLLRASYFAWGIPIPRWLLVATAKLQGDEPDIKLQAEDALSRLVELGLLETEEDGALRLHRLLAMFVRDVADKDDSGTEAQSDVEQVLLTIANVVNKEGYPAPLVELQPHLRAVTTAAMDRDDESAATLCIMLGSHLYTIGEYAEAHPLFDKALSIYEKVLGPDHPDTATSLNALALLFNLQGDYDHARPLYERALAICEKVLGPDHPQTATSLDNLAILLYEQGDYAGARSLYERALAIWEKVVGPDHPDTATSLNNLALLLKSQGDYAGARPLYERALAIREKVLGPDHPDTATSLNNLAELLRTQGYYDDARSLYERTLTIWEKVLGPDHPNTAVSLSNLAILLDSQGDYAGARSLHERALAIKEKVLGPDHPDTATSLNNLAILCYHQNNYEEAAILMQRALSIYYVKLGANHPSTLRAFQNLEAIKKKLRKARRWWSRR